MKSRRSLRIDRKLLEELAEIQDAAPTWFPIEYRPMRLCRRVSGCRHRHPWPKPGRDREHASPRANAMAVAIITAIDRWAAPSARTWRSGWSCQADGDCTGGRSRRVGVGSLAGGALTEPDQETCPATHRELARSARQDELSPVTLALLGERCSRAGDAKIAERFASPRPATISA